MNSWLVAVSGGCDSMTLLDLCIQHNLPIQVAHVNYQKRETAKRDENIVREYCEKHHIVCHVAYCSPEYQGNFQAYARDFRYAFFKELVMQQNLLGVLVAHQMDDVLETYYMQKERKSIPLYYGIKKETIYQGIRIVRPLLSMTKKQCYEYCQKHHVPYGEDESNFTHDYLRNCFRLDVMKQWSDDKKASVLKEIQLKNEEKEKHEAMIAKECALFKEDLDIALFKKTSYPIDVLRYWLNQQNIGFQCSQKYLKLISDTILADQGPYTFQIEDKITLEKSYDVVQIVKDISFCYQFDQLREFECDYFKICRSGTSMQALTLFEDDFPITIRSPKKDDKIHLRFGTKKVNRFFIDRKISHKERKCWPIVVNRVGNVIFVHEIGCDIQHYTNKANCFVVK